MQPSQPSRHHNKPHVLIYRENQQAIMLYVCANPPTTPNPQNKTKTKTITNSRRNNNTCRAVPADAVTVFFKTMQTRAAFLCFYPAISTILPLNHTHSYTGGDLYNNRKTMIYVCVPSHLSLNK